MAAPQGITRRMIAMLWASPEPEACEEILEALDRLTERERKVNACIEEYVRPS